MLGKVWPGEDGAARLAAIEHTLDEEAGAASWRRRLRPGLAQAADHRARPRHLPADHRHQRDHLLRQPDLRRGRLLDAGSSRRPRRPGRSAASTSRRPSSPSPSSTSSAGGRCCSPGWSAWALALLVVGIAFLSIDAQPVGDAQAPGGPTTAGIVTLVALVVFIISFAFSLGPVTWTVINEIFPGQVRGRAVAVATAVNWGSAFLVSQFFLTLIDGDRHVGDLLAVRLLLRSPAGSGSTARCPRPRAGRSRRSSGAGPDRPPWRPSEPSRRLAGFARLSNECPQRLLGSEHRHTKQGSRQCRLG